MNARGSSRAFYLIAFVAIATAVYCIYRAVPLGITSDEGLRYSLPHLQGAEAAQNKALFDEMKRKADQWSSAAAWSLGLSCVFCLIGWQIQKSVPDPMND